MNQPFSKEDIQKFLDQMGSKFDVTLLEVTDKGARLELKTNKYHLRPGGTVSGPTMMALADAAMYAAKRDGKNTCMRFSTLMMSTFRAWEVTPPGGVSLAEIHSPSGVDLAHEPDSEEVDPSAADRDRATSPPSARSSP